MRGQTFFTIALLSVCSLTALHGDEPIVEDTSPTLAVLSDPQAPPFYDLITTELAAKLTGNGWKVVDREHLSKVVKEHSLSATGLTRDPIQLRKLIAAEYLISGAGMEDPTRKTVSLLCVEVRSGNVVFETTHTFRPIDFDKASSKWLTGLVPKLDSRISENETARADGRPTATVLPITDRGRLRRLSFLETTLHRVCEELLEAAGYRVLRRHQLKISGDETRVSVLGLTRPDARVLASTADLVISGGFSEQPSLDKAFVDTPIHLDLKVQAKSQAAKSRKIEFTLAARDKLIGELRSCIPETRDVTVREAEETNDDRNGWDAELEAAEILANVHAEKSTRHPRRSGWTVERARRILYLDPTCVEAQLWLGRALSMGDRHDQARNIAKLKESKELLIRSLRSSPSDRTETYEANRTLFVFVYRALAYYEESERSDDAWREAMGQAYDFVRWYSRQDQPLAGNFVGYSYVYWLPDSPYFEKWSRENPQALADFYHWTSQQYEVKRQDKGWGSRDLVFAKLFLKAAESSQQVKQHQRAADYLYKAIIAVPLRADLRAELHRMKFIKDGKWKTIVPHLEQERANAVISRITPKPRKPLPRRISVSKLHGGFIPVDDLADTTASQPWLLSLGDYSQVEAEEIKLPKHVRYTSVAYSGASGVSFHAVHADASHAVMLLDPKGNLKSFPLPQRVPTTMAYRPRNIIETNGSLIVVLNVFRMNQAEPPLPVHVFDVRNETHRAYGPKDGVPSSTLPLSALDPEGNLWFGSYGWGKSLSRFRDGKWFVSGKKPPADGIRIGGCIAASDRFIVLPDFHNHSLQYFDRKTEEFRKLNLRPSINKSSPVAEPFSSLPKRWGGNFNGTGAVVFVGERFLVAVPQGLLEFSGDVHPEKLWYPRGLYYWRELCGVVEGNSPLPPSEIEQLVPDDRDSNVMWIVSRDRQSLSNAYDFNRPKPGKKAGVYITRFDVSRGVFSPPILVKTSTVQIAPFGDHLYITGAGLARLSKTFWKKEDPTSTKILSDRIRTSDTTYGNASAALLRGDRSDAIAILEKALEAKTAPTQTEQLIKSLRSMKN